MRCSIVFAALIAVTTAAPTGLIRQTLTGPEIPGDRDCTPSGSKCAGDEGFPSIPFAPCCDTSQTCGYPLEANGQWGRFCLANDLVTGNKTKQVTTAPTSTTAVDESTSIITTTTDADANATTTGTTTTITTTTTSSIDDDDACFPADATVELENGAVVRIDTLAIGDMVKVGVSEYSRVFMFTHKMADSQIEFLTLKTTTGSSITLTKGHYLYVNGALAAASTVSVGDSLTLGTGESSAVVAVGAATGAGLYNPQTVNGNVVVNGVLSSTYTTAVEPVFAHAVLAPLRMLSGAFGFTLTGLESGGGALAAAVPRGVQTL